MEKNKSCSSSDIALKSFFLGPQAENSEWLLSQVHNIFKQWVNWRKQYHPEDGYAISASDLQVPAFIDKQKATSQALDEICHRFENEIPKFSPRYIGHMFSEISLPALLGHFQTLLHNPNNISGESSRVGIELENEAIHDLGIMLGFSNTQGHFTSGGTVANFEALFRARARLWDWMSAGIAAGVKPIEAAHMGWKKYSQLDHSKALSFNPLKTDPLIAYKKILEIDPSFQSPVLLVPAHKHYSWSKGAYVFGLGEKEIWSIPLDNHGHLCVRSLQILIEKALSENRSILGIVSVLGTTELGFIDPIDEVQNLVDSYQEKGIHLWHHIDAAYGAFFCSMKGSPEEEKVISEKSCKALKSVGRVTSVTLDPHKLAYVPYACGAFLCPNPKDYFNISFGAPYVNMENTLDKGPFTLEGSRSATGAVATWMTSKCVGFNSDGYGRIISRTIQLKKDLENELRSFGGIFVAPYTDTNLLGFCMANVNEKTSVTNERNLAIYEKFNQKDSLFYVSKTKLSFKNYGEYLKEWTKEWNPDFDTEDLVLVRLCIMNPFLRSKEMKKDLLTDFIQSLSLFKNLN